MQRGDFRPKLVESDGGSELVDQLVALGIVQVVFVLLGVVEPALNCGQPSGPLGGWKVFEFLKQRLLSSSRRLIDS